MDRRSFFQRTLGALLAGTAARHTSANDLLDASDFTWADVSGWPTVTHVVLYDEWKKTVIEGQDFTSDTIKVSLSTSDFN